MPEAVGAAGPEWGALAGDRDFRNLVRHQLWFANLLISQSDEAISSLESTIQLVRAATS